jgi:hypothetical protein
LIWEASLLAERMNGGRALSCQLAIGVKQSHRHHIPLTRKNGHYLGQQ